jgi:hypothetical protein
VSAGIRSNGHFERKSPNFLFTFAHKDARECAKHFCEQPHRRILVDSGAFTQWKKGTPVGDEYDKYFTEYIDFCKEIQRRATCPVTFVALDVPLGTKDDKLEDLTDGVIEQACEKGWANYNRMQQEGIPCLPVFHQLENTKWLKRFADNCDYIAVSPRKNLRPTIRHRWLKMVFRCLGRSTKIHGLGVSSNKWLMEFPFFSADNTDWQRPGKHKRYPMPGGRNWSLRDWENLARRDSISVLLLKKMLGPVIYEPDHDKPSGWPWLHTLAMARELEKQHQITEHWRKKGVVWNEETAESMIITE